ncbi:MAG: hypothetical protein Q9184_001166 [Pyrenodesmia sp. 2 TL-2023]
MTLAEFLPHQSDDVPAYIPSRPTKLVDGVREPLPNPTADQITRCPLPLTKPTDSAVPKDATRSDADSGSLRRTFQMVIHLPHDECAQRICYLDTGAAFDVVSHQVVESLRLKKDIHQEASLSLASGHLFRPEPRVTFDWHVAEHRKTYTTTFVVSYATDSGDFDVLLGSPTIQQIGFYRTGSPSSLGSAFHQAPRPATPRGSGNATDDGSRPEITQTRFTSYPLPPTCPPDFEGGFRPEMQPTLKRKRRNYDDAEMERRKCSHMPVDPESTSRSPSSPNIEGGIIEDTLPSEGQYNPGSREGRPENSQADAETAPQPSGETDSTSVSASAESEDKATVQAAPQTAIPWIRETCKKRFASQSNPLRHRSRQDSINESGDARP